MSLWKRLTKRNVGTFDRILRVLPSIAFVFVWMTGTLTGGALVALGIVAAMLLATAATGFCSLYAMLGISTRSPSGM